MYFSAAVFALASAAVVSAANIQVLVGDGGNLAFTPSSVTAQSGDVVSFEFRAKNHSVTQSTFANPCSIMTTPNTGVDSGFQPVPAGSTSFASWSFTVDDPSTPLWFFCAQTAPANHCKAGMVFAVNAPPDKTFDAYQANAKASNPDSAPPAGTASSSGGLPGTTNAPFPTGTTVATGGLPSPSGFSTVIGTTPGSTGTSTDGASGPSTTGNSALKLGGSASSLLALVGLLTGLML